MLTPAMISGCECQVGNEHKIKQATQAGDVNSEANAQQLIAKEPLTCDFNLPIKQNVRIHTYLHVKSRDAHKHGR